MKTAFAFALTCLVLSSHAQAAESVRAFYFGNSPTGATNPKWHEDRGRPLGDEGWVESIVRRLGLESTMRPRGRQRVRPVPEEQNKEA
jgi:hypothetical protein